MSTLLLGSFPAFLRRGLRYSVSFSAALAISLAAAPEASAKCIRQSLVNHDYCGPEGSWKSALVPEGVFADFKGSCAAHDVCYSFGAEKIVNLMERKYQQSMLDATRQQKNEFSTEINSTRRSCDNRLLRGLNQSCSRVEGLKQSACLKVAALYYRKVDQGGARYFDEALDQAFTCRIS